MSKKRRKFIMVEIKEKDRKLIQDLADQFAACNLSLWVRQAALRYRPKPEELQGVLLPTR